MENRPVINSKLTAQKEGSFVAHCEVQDETA
jgi:hypothetical protein